MKSINLFFAGASLALLPLAASAADESIRSFDLAFPEPIFSETAHGLEMTMPNLARTIDLEMPAVPFHEIRVALPPGSSAPRIALRDVESHELEQELAPYSPFPAPQGTPRHHGSFDVQMQTLHGIPIAIVRVFAARTAAGLQVLRKVRLEISFDEPAQGFAPDLRLRPHQWTQVSAMVSNPDDLADLRAAQKNRLTASNDYLIITARRFADFRGPNDIPALQQSLSADGLHSSVVTVEEIAAKQSGADLIEKIRAHIRQQYQDSGIRYVLLLGDGDDRGNGATIPARKLWSKVRGYNGGWSIIEREIPADLYYACLDGTFNFDGDRLWGEPGDGENGGDVDLTAEVTVGRISVDSPQDMQNAIQKSIAFRSTPQSPRALMLGEMLFPELRLSGKAYLDQLVGQSTDHGYATQGFPSQWQVQRMYDDDGEWSGAQALSRINGGDFTFVHHIGHSNTSSNMRLSTGWNSPRFTNPRPYFYYTEGCYPGAFNADDSFIERLLRAPAAFAGAVANSVYGLGPEDPDPSQTATPGASHMLHRQFVDALFAEQQPSLGTAHQDSKHDNLAFSATQEMRWVFWAANYFGDPSLPLRTR